LGRIFAVALGGHENEHMQQVEGKNAQAESDHAQPGEGRQMLARRHVNDPRQQPDAEKDRDDRGIEGPGLQHHRRQHAAVSQHADKEVGKPRIFQILQVENAIMQRVEIKPEQEEVGEQQQRRKGDEQRKIVGAVDAQMDLAENFVIQRLVAAAVSSARYSFALHFPDLSDGGGIGIAASGYFTVNNN